MKVIIMSAANCIHTVRWVNALSNKGLEVILVSLKNHKDFNNDINKKVKIIYLPVKGTKGYFINRIFINKIIKKERQKRNRRETEERQRGKIEKDSHEIGRAHV